MCHCIVSRFYKIEIVRGAEEKVPIAMELDARYEGTK